MYHVYKYGTKRYTYTYTHAHTHTHTNSYTCMKLNYSDGNFAVHS